jgi:arginine/lysine/histidine/glutamine transport system substrate-binding/permease protein
MQPRVLSRLFFVLLAVGGAGRSYAQGIVDTIRSRGELVIATDATYPPFEVKKGDQIVGFDADVGAELARELGVKVRWINLEWAGVLGCLESGKSDLVMAGVTITEERKTKGYLFSRPYFLSGQVIARRKGDTRIQRPQDLRDKIVSVQAETTGQFAVQRIGVPKDHMLKFDQIQDALLDLRNGKSDAVVADLPTLQAILRQGYPEIELAGPVFVKENLGVVAWKTHPELIAQVNLALDKMMVDGRYATFYQKWFQEPLTTALVAELDHVKDQGSPVPPVKALPSGAIPASKPVSGSAFTFRWDLLREAFPLLMQGARLTLILTAFSLVLGVSGGLILALARISPLIILRPFAMAYVEVVRGTPLLMQIYVIYFVLPAVGVELSSFVAGVLALSCNAAAYSSEIFRAGIESIDSGQMEAARSLGMDYRRAMRWVILPQTLKRVLTNEAVALLKDSSLVSVVALSELMREGKEIATNSGSPTTVYLSVAFVYLAMTLPLTWLVRRLEVRWSPNSRPAIRGAK